MRGARASIGGARRIADLRQLIDHHAVVRQHVADRAQIAELRRQHRKIGGDRSLSARLASTRSGRIGESLREMRREAPEHRCGIADDADLGLADAIHLGRIDVDLDDGELVVDAPGD